MPELLIDESLCNGCGVCSYVCPVNIIRINAGESPRYCADGAGRCIICGHCQAACPSGALRLQDERFENVEYSGESAIDPAGLIGPPDDEAQQDQNDTRKAENKWHAEPGGDNAAEDWSSHRADLLGSE